MARFGYSVEVLLVVVFAMCEALHAFFIEDDNAIQGQVLLNLHKNVQTEYCT